jgi:hypothetical protein
MPSTAIGNHAKISARAIDRERIRKFYHEVLGCEMTKRSNEIDFFRFAGEFFVAVIYDNAGLPDDDHTRVFRIAGSSEDLSRFEA